MKTAKDILHLLEDVDASEASAFCDEIIGGLKRVGAANSQVEGPAWRTVGREDHVTFRWTLHGDKKKYKDMDPWTGAKVYLDISPNGSGEIYFTPGTFRGMGDTSAKVEFKNLNSASKVVSQSLAELKRIGWDFVGGKL